MNRQRDNLIELCQSIADLQAEVDKPIYPATLAQIGKLFSTLQWPCSDLMRSKWEKLRIRMEVASKATQDERHQINHALRSMIDQSWTVLEVTRLCLRAHPQVDCGTLEPIVADELYRLAMQPPAQVTTAQDPHSQDQSSD